MKLSLLTSALIALYLSALPSFADQEPQAYQAKQDYQSTQQQIQPLLPAGLIVTSTMNVDGYKVIEYKGLVRGVAVRQPTIMQGFKASFKSIVGGNIGSYEQMCEQARDKAYQVMVDKATALGANAVLCVRFDSSAFNSSPQEMGSEVICYGTAVTIVKQ